MTGSLLAEEPFATWADRTGAAHELVGWWMTRAAQTGLPAGDHARAVRLARPRRRRNALFASPPGGTDARHCGARAPRPGPGRAYADLRALMLEELGVEPGRHQRLYLTILDGAGRTGRRSGRGRGAHAGPPAAADARGRPA